MSIKEHVPLAPLTTFGVGGNARFFAEAHDAQEVKEAITFARTHAMPLFVLGGGSNIVVADGGFDGLVLAVRIPTITSEESGDTVVVTAGAGVAWDDLVAYSIRRGLAGLECLSGVPGTVGGAVVANIGAYGEQCSDTFVRADVCDLRDASATIRVVEKNECLFSYHESVFGNEPGRYIVLRASFALLAGGMPRLSYQDNHFRIAELASKNGGRPTLADVRAAVLAVRGQKGSLSSSYKSAGSFFHMPFVSPEAYARIITQARTLDAEKEERLRPWAWEQPDDTFKLAPGFLLEYTEFQKGYVRGPVGISPKHTLTIINRAGARARDIVQLAEDMQTAVEKIFGIRLEREVECVGFA